MSAKDLTIHFPDAEFRDKLEFIAKREFRTPEGQNLYFVNQAIEAYFSTPVIAQEYASYVQEPKESGIPF